MQMHQVGRELDLLADQVHLSIHADPWVQKQSGLDMGCYLGLCRCEFFAVFLLADKLRTPLNDAVIMLQQGGLDDNFDQW